MAWIKWFGVGLGALALVLVGMNAYGAWRWATRTKTLISRLQAARVATATSRYDARELEGLTAPVQRYFRAALKGGQPIITAANVEHQGSFNLGESTDQWKTSRRVEARGAGPSARAAGGLQPGVPIRCVYWAVRTQPCGRPPRGFEIGTDAARVCHR